MKGAITFLSGAVTLCAGDCREAIKTIPAGSIDAVVTDPPYALVSIRRRFGKEGAAPIKGNAAYQRASAGFMGKAWDTGEVAFDPAFWLQVLRALKPGGHVVAFSGTRTYHRLAVAIEDAGFEIRDQLAWCYGTGFPKSHDVSKAIDKVKGGGGTRQDPRARGYHEMDGGEPATDEGAAWQGWGTSLKPAWEPIALARKPLSGTVAENVLRHGTGAININGCRIDVAARARQGRYPANIVHDGSEEVLAAFPQSESTPPGNITPSPATREIFGAYGERSLVGHADSGSCARFFYSAKADADDRLGSKHPTVKPVDLMQWLVRLITPPGGTVLDPFAGTGTTGEAAFREGMKAVLIEREPEYQADIARRMHLAQAGPAERAREAVKARGLVAGAGPLFGDSVAERGGDSSTAGSPRTGHWFYWARAMGDDT